MNTPFVFKKCAKCGRWLVANTINFHKQKGGKYGLKANCKECRNTHSREHYEEHIEYYKKYYEENKEKIAKYYEENKEKIAKREKEYHNSPKGQVILFNAHNKRRQRIEQQGNGITKDQWLDMMKYFEFKCAYSGVILNTDTRSVDHIMPLTKDGAHEIWNCVPMDKSLNKSKNDKNIKEWYPQQDFYDEDRLNKINEWREYAYNKWGKQK